MDEARPRPSLADDLAFMADVDALDQGLTQGGAGPAVPTVAATRPVPAATEADSEPILTPFALRDAASVPIVLQPGSRRPLLDLFPPMTSPAAQMPVPVARDTAAAPRVTHAGGAAPLAEQPVASPEPRRDETFYGFAEPAFAIEPDVRFLYHSTAHDEAARQIGEAIARRDGVIVVTGPTGIGKTLLCQTISEQLDRRTQRSVMLTPPASFDDLVQTLLVELGVLPREEFAIRIAEHFGDLPATVRSCMAPLASLHAVLVIDEAQDVAADVLASLCTLADSIPGTLQIVLAGQPSLLRVLERPELRMTNERVGLRVQVGPLAADEVPGYVMHRIHVAAAAPRIDFDDEALALLFEVTGGVPRAINRVCDGALRLAFDRSSIVVAPATVAAAAALLGMSPRAARPDALRIVALVVVVLLLMSVGAGGAAWLFRDRVHQIVAQWQTRAPARR